VDRAGPETDPTTNLSGTADDDSNPATRDIFQGEKSLPRNLLVDVDCAADFPICCSREVALHSGDDVGEIHAEMRSAVSVNAESKNVESEKNLRPSNH
jgi:hypothetical protein